jgi:hypothetical protein
MGVLNLSDLKAGMVLAADVKNKHGNILMKAGILLAEKHLMVLKTWGISEADVVGVEKDQVVQEELNTISPELIEAIENDLRKFFPPLDNQPVLAEIFRITRKLKLKQTQATPRKG